MEAAAFTLALGGAVGELRPGAGADLVSGPGVTEH